MTVGVLRLAGSLREEPFESLGSSIMTGNRCESCHHDSHGRSRPSQDGRSVNSTDSGCYVSSLRTMGLVTLEASSSSLPASYSISTSTTSNLHEPWPSARTPTLTHAADQYRNPIPTSLRSADLSLHTSLFPSPSCWKDTTILLRVVRGIIPPLSVRILSLAPLARISSRLTSIS